MSAGLISRPSSGLVLGRHHKSQHTQVLDHCSVIVKTTPYLGNKTEWAEHFQVIQVIGPSIFSVTQEL